MRTLILLSLTVLAMNGAMAQEPATVITYAAGDFRVSTLSEGGRAGQSSLLKGATPEMLQKYLPDGTFPLEVQAFLVRTPDRNILIDAGYGTNLFTNLQSLEITEDQVDVILLTHLHGDHIGGLLRDGKAAFPHAEMYLSQAEHDYWTNQERGDAARKMLAAYRDRLHLFVPSAIGEAPSELFTGIQAIAAYGHTPGHTAFLFHSGESKWLIWGDVTHAMPIQMPCPDVALSFDTDPELAIRTRKTIFEYVARHKITVGGMHIPFPAVGNVTSGKEEGYAFTPLCLCEGI
ncbi:MAG: MBL fold metallo-hydrolase [Tannerella sp.]|jgi:glyoxylase-like metal-dependent hydrolase (beta-lactamase superfamily II)|nr:MBL fold metallo-hydrolase [Tannerella sp.]